MIAAVRPLPLAIFCCLVMAVPPAAAADDARGYAGALLGVSTLSADGRTSVTPSVAAASLYTPENGLAANGFVGVHVHRFVSIQANYIGNRNRVALLSSVTTPVGGSFSEQVLSSVQHAVVADVLVYMRPIESRVRPYFSLGAGMVRLDDGRPALADDGGLPLVPGSARSTHAGLRVAVGIDVAMVRAWSFRYSFSEAITDNPLSARLNPPGRRSLANFQSLFGIVRSL